MHTKRSYVECTRYILMIQVEKSECGVSLVFQNVVPQGSAVCTVLFEKLREKFKPNELIVHAHEA